MKRNGVEKVALLQRMRNTRVKVITMNVEMEDSYRIKDMKGEVADG